MGLQIENCKLKNANLLGSLFGLYIFILNSAIGNEVLAIFQKVKLLPWT